MQQARITGLSSGADLNEVEEEKIVKGVGLARRRRGGPEAECACSPVAPRAADERLAIVPNSGCHYPLMDRLAAETNAMQFGKLLTGSVGAKSE